MARVLQTPTASLADEDLVDRASRGDGPAFDEFYRRFAPPTWRFAYALTGDQEAAGRAVATAFIELVRTAVPTAPVRPTVSVRLLASVRTTVASATPAETPEDADPLPMAFHALPAQWRAAVWVVEVEGLRAKDTAAVIGLAPEAAERLVERALAGLRERYLHDELRWTSARDCRRAIERLADYLDDALHPGDRAKVDAHVSRCGDCAAAQTDLTNTGKRLRMMAVALPAAVAAQAKQQWEQWLVAKPRRRLGLPAAWNDKAVAAAAIAVLAGGVIGTALYESGRAKVGAYAAPAAIGGLPDSTDTSIVIDQPFVHRTGPFSATGSATTAGGGTASDVARGSLPASGGALAGTTASPPPSSAPAPPPDSGSGGGGTTPPPSPDPDPAPDASPTGDVVSVDRTLAGHDVSADVGVDDGHVNVDVDVEDAPPLHIGL